MSDFNSLSTNELYRSEMDSEILYDGDDSTEQIFGIDNTLYDDQPVYDNYFAGFGEAQTVDPEDAELIIADNFHILKSGVPDGDNRHLWGLAKDCLRKEDSAAEYVSDLIATGDYPVEGNGDSFYESYEDLNAALKYSSLRAILPNAETAYVWGIAKEYANSRDDVFNQFVLHLQESGDYPQSDLSSLTPEQRTELKKLEMSRNASLILNTIDSRYIEEKLNTDPTLGYNEEGVSQLILSLMDNARLHPSKTEEYYRKVTLEAIEGYSDAFDMNRFLQRFPQPVMYFEHPAYPGGPKYRSDVYKYLRQVVMADVTNERIRQTLKMNVTLLKCHRSFFGDSVPLQTIEYELTDECGRFINELTYIRFQETILPTAAIYASLHENTCEGAEGWYEDEALQCELCEDHVPAQKVLTCTEAHIFCAECVRGWANERLGQGHVVVNCLQSCTGTMPDEQLSRVLPAGALDKVVKKRQEQDVGAANVDGIQHCLWCDYSYVPRYEDMDLVCLNPDCGEKWCKKCRQLAHHPRPCEDTPEEVKKRVYIEERMTNAMVKTCPRCNAGIVKDGGCDFVKCKCGTGICYNCGQESQHHYCSQMRVVRNVNAEGQSAKAEADRIYPNVALNNDPTRLL